MMHAHVPDPTHATVRRPRRPAAHHAPRADALVAAVAAAAVGLLLLAPPLALSAPAAVGAGVAAIAADRDVPLATPGGRPRPPGTVPSR